jgi:hypothetical protein
LTASTPQRLSNTNTNIATARIGGTISPTRAVSVSHGANQTFAITAATNCKIDRVLVDGAPRWGR